MIKFTRKNLHDYQVSTGEFIEKTKKCGLFLDMGLGKTVTALTAASDFLDDFLINKVLIIAPLRVANTVWKQECRDWAHLKNLKITICTGSTNDRRRALNSDADVYVINRENVLWLVNNTTWKWDMVIIDESSSFKSHASKRFKALKKVTKHIKSILLLTGTPSPNGYMDLWSQLYLIDNGKRLGRTITNYRQRFFKQSGYMGYGYELRKGAKEEINKLIADVCISMESDDYIKLPEKIDVTQYVELPPKIMAQYKELEKEFLLELEGCTDIEVLFEAALTNKLLQFCNGAIYDENKNYHILHDLKIKALSDFMEDNPNETFMVAYNYKSDLERLQKAFPKMITMSKSGKELSDWNKGKIKMLAVHPASAGHGLNAQFGGSIVVWFGLNWSLELYLQLNKRLHRQGQLKPVRIVHLVAKGCMDEKLMKAIYQKAKTQQELMDHLKYQL